MSRLRILVASILLFSAKIAAGESDLAAAAQSARTQAEREVAATRQRIADEQAALLADLQATVAAGNAARDRLTTAEHEAKAANDELSKRQKDQERELAVVKQLADRAVVAARLGETEAKRLAGTPPLERVAAAVAGIERRTLALADRLALRLVDESVVGRNGALANVPVLRLGEARAVALGAESAHRGVLERASDGRSWLVLGPELPPLPPLPASGGIQIIPLDAAGTAAHQAPEVRRTFAQWLKAGRFFIWPILAVLALGLAIIVERSFALARRRVEPRRLLAVAARLAANDPAGAETVVAAGASPLDRVLRAGLGALGRPREAREAVVEQALLAETGQLTRGLSALAVLAGVAPLLGLLGTVTGMIDMFSVIAAQGSGNAKSLSGGISEALICTQAGMLVAIPLLLAHAWLGRIADRRAQLLEEAACGVLGLAEHGESEKLDRTAQP